MKRIIIIILSLVVILSISFSAFWVYQWSDYRKPFKMKGFDTFQSELKSKHDYARSIKLSILKSDNIELEVTTKRALEWSEVEDLFINDIAVFLRSDIMMNKIKEIRGDDPIKELYPGFLVRIYFYSSANAYAVLFESSYYNTPDMTKLTQENIQGYNKWGADGSVVPDGRKVFNF